MGSSAIAMTRAVAACRREMLRSRCDEVATHFRAEGVVHRVTVSPFELDRTEVTVSDYARCVQTGACEKPGFSPANSHVSSPQLPVTQVRWEDAARYCAWAKGRLPTEAEWEFAARGIASRTYPWGDVYNPRLCNHGAFAPDETDASDGFAGLAPVGSFPDGATPEGILDMAGNVAEWVSDLFEVDDGGFGYAAAPQVNPKGPKAGTSHVLRGGSYVEGAPWMRAASRGSLNLHRSPAVGFRCAADIPSGPPPDPPNPGGGAT